MLILQEAGAATPEGLVDWIVALAPSALILVLTIVVAAALRHWFERSASSAQGHKVRNQLILLALTAVGLLIVVLMLPISDDFRSDILGLVGIVLSAGIALSSTTFLGNMLAGLMLRAVRNFRSGDFIGVQEHFGRVSERGLFHTEIQTEERNLVTLPNLYLVTNPVTTVRSSGTIVAATVSLGYDVPRARIEELLLEAARNANLEDPFVTTQELGDFSVTYRIAGLLTEVKSLISARSRLRGAMLDSLHGGGIEIVSPIFHNQRKLEPDQLFIPRVEPRKVATVEEEAAVPEEILFDKAEQAEAEEKMERTLSSVSDEIKALDAELKSASEEERPALEQKRQRLEVEKERLSAKLEREKEENNKKKEEERG
jgi:small-conductance mechanosensitive channel